MGIGTSFGRSRADKIANLAVKISRLVKIHYIVMQIDSRLN